MAAPEKAKLIEIQSLSESQAAFQQDVTSEHIVIADFNPQSLKVSYANQNTGGSQPAGSSGQHVGSLSSKMSVELLFDTSEAGGDVRAKTKRVAYFITPKTPEGSNDESKRVPPYVRFQWGSFIFEGRVDSMDETLDYFSEEGMPMRATVALNLSSDTGVFIIGRARSAANAAPGRQPATGATEPLKQARPGDSLQQMAGRQGKSADWKAIAAANNIDDPLRMAAGALVNLNRR